MKTIPEELQELFSTAKFLWDNNLTGAVKEAKPLPVLSYHEARVYNAIARIFGSILEPCGSAAVIDQALHISYNGDKHKLLATHKNSIEYLSQQISNWNSSHNKESSLLINSNDSSVLDVLGMVLFFQMKNDANLRRILKLEDIKQLAKNLQEKYTTATKSYQPIQKLSEDAYRTSLDTKNQDTKEELLQSNKKEQQKLYSQFILNYQGLARDYIELLNHLVTNNIMLKDNDIKLLRPLQDVYKLNNVFSVLNINKIELNEHEDDLHAEIALFLSEIFKDQNLSKQFIGISKYCCFICEELLQYKNIQHSGGHNIFTEQKDVLKTEKLSVLDEEQRTQFLTQLKTALIEYLKTHASEDSQKILAAGKDTGYFLDPPQPKALSQLEGIQSKTAYQKFQEFCSKVWPPFLQQLDNGSYNILDTLATQLQYFGITKASDLKFLVSNANIKKQVLNIPVQEFDLSDDEEMECGIFIFEGLNLWQLKRALKASIQLEQYKNRDGDEEYNASEPIFNQKEYGLSYAYSADNYWKLDPIGNIDELLNE